MRGTIIAAIGSLAIIAVPASGQFGVVTGLITIAIITAATAFLMRRYGE